MGGDLGVLGCSEGGGGFVGMIWGVSKRGLGHGEG